MALTKCKDCGKEISTDAKACPACGAPPPKPTSRATLAVAGISVLVMVSCVTAEINRKPSAPKQAADPAKERRFQDVVMGAMWIKKNMKNPASFELVSAVRMADSMICYEYRGTNSFNAIITSRRVIGDALNSDDARAWNKHCAGKSGEDFTYARRAL